MTGMKWQDDSMSSPLYALMRELADDEAPHLNGMPEESPEVQALRARAMEGLKSGRRATGAAKAAVTKAARAASTEGGQYPKLTDGSAKQTVWATKIRSEKAYASHAYRNGGWDRTIDPGMDAIIRRRTTAKFWIDTRSMSWERMVEKYAPKA